MKIFGPKNKRGMGMVEIIIGVTIIAIGILSLVGSFFYFLRIMAHNTPTIQAAYLLEEGIETMRLLRDQSWTTNISPLLASSTAKYYLTFNTATSKWSTTLTKQVVDGLFERTVTATSTYRNSSNNIVAYGTSGATLDASTTLITVNVAWRDGTSTTTKSLSAYLANIFSN